MLIFAIELWRELYEFFQGHVLFAEILLLQLVHLLVDEDLGRVSLLVQPCPIKGDSTFMASNGFKLDQLWLASSLRRQIVVSRHTASSHLLTIIYNSL